MFIGTRRPTDEQHLGHIYIRRVSNSQTAQNLEAFCFVAPLATTTQSSDRSKCALDQINFVPISSTRAPVQVGIKSRRGPRFFDAYTVQPVNVPWIDHHEFLVAQDQSSAQLRVHTTHASPQLFLYANGVFVLQPTSSAPIVAVDEARKLPPIATSHRVTFMLTRNMLMTQHQIWFACVFNGVLGNAVSAFNAIINCGPSVNAAPPPRLTQVFTFSHEAIARCHLFAFPFKYETPRDAADLATVNMAHANHQLSFLLKMKEFDKYRVERDLTAIGSHQKELLLQILCHNMESTGILSELLKFEDDDDATCEQDKSPSNPAKKDTS